MLVPAQILIDINLGPDSDIEELEQHSLWLQDELLELDVDSVKRVAAEAAPPGAKGSISDTAGLFILTVSNSAVAAALTGVLRSWIDRHNGRKVTVRIGEDLLEINQVSSEDQAKLIGAWLDRHA